VVEVPHRSPASAKHPLGIAVEVEVPGRPLVVAREQEERHDAKHDQSVAVNRAFEEVDRRLGDVAAVRYHEVAADPRGDVVGMVVRLFPEQNYGFVEIRGSPNLYFAREVVDGEGFDGLEIGEEVRVEIAEGEGPMGPQASRVTQLNRRHAG